jgi:TonB family protein
MMKRFGGLKLALIVAGSICLLAGCAPDPPRQSTSLRHRAQLPDRDTVCPAPQHLLEATDSDYGRQFMGHVSELVTYPPEAMAAGQGGVVRLCVRLTRDGTVQDGHILTGSGFPVLDGAALLAVGELKRTPQGREAIMPHGFATGRQRVWIAFNIEFKPESVVTETFPREADDRPCKENGSLDGDNGLKTVSPDDWSGFPSAFSEAVKRELMYPEEALDGGVSGHTRLCVALDSESHLLGVSISHSSGSPLLDASSLMAIGMMQLNNEIPQLPQEVRHDHSTVTFTHEIDWSPKPKKVESSDSIK